MKHTVTLNCVFHCVQSNETSSLMLLSGKHRNKTIICHPYLKSTGYENTTKPLY